MWQRLTERFFSLGLLITLSIPFAINSLHFIIFEHHNHDHQFTKGENLVANDKTHQICQWDFAIEELNDPKIAIETPFIYQSPNFLFNDKSIFVIKEDYFLLRAPPIS